MHAAASVLSLGLVGRVDMALARLTVLTALVSRSGKAAEPFWTLAPPHLHVGLIFHAFLRC